ncbi:hypothetical protein LZQ00_17640 [Sphingobacterium sp. SRCM116780]|uniref:hypothetical protein n=1 Tax=Sphingobacterium sp. SRCM116780 TaxID=2907623 RepID=UPI001F47D71A|nr:hypothetical protein [Sphingobacterium sp. SRCM116780]UIR56073.1 hypothetical protein LZQ00_17640 [Sphingobacterium sp. SRCM116780]
MKNTQKKLKAKQFRHLSKDIIKNPMIYIDEYFRHQNSIITWQNDINLFVNAGAYPAMSCSNLVGNGYHCKEMIRQIEVAYVIFKQCRIAKQVNPLQLFETQADYCNYIENLEFTCNGKRDPQYLISKFFSFQSLREWYETMDDLMSYLTVNTSNEEDKFGDSIVVIRELLIRLGFALSYIYEDDGLFTKMPSYLKAEPDEVPDEEMSCSQLSEM